MKTLWVKVYDFSRHFVVVHIVVVISIWHIKLRKHVFPEHFPRTWLYFSRKHSSGELMLVSRLQKVNRLKIEVNNVSTRFILPNESCISPVAKVTSWFMENFFVFCGSQVNLGYQGAP